MNLPVFTHITPYYGCKPSFPNCLPFIINYYADHSAAQFRIIKKHNLIHIA